MTNFTKTRLTDKGLALLAKTGVSVTVTKVKTGNGEYQTDADIGAMTELKSEKQEFQITSTQKKTDTTYAIKFVMSNKELAEDYLFTEIGIYASDPDEGEILYAVCYAENKDADMIRKYSGLYEFKAIIVLNIQVNAGGVVKVVEQGLYALAEDLEELRAEVGDKVDKEEGKGLSHNDFTDADKKKLDGVSEGANKTVIDSELSETSTNPVENKVIYQEQVERLLNQWDTSAYGGYVWYGIDSPDVSSSAKGTYFDVKNGRWYDWSGRRWVELPKSATKISESLSNKVEKTQIVNNLVTTEEGYVADARQLNKSVENSFAYEMDKSISAINDSLNNVSSYCHDEFNMNVSRGDANGLVGGNHRYFMIFGKNCPENHGFLETIYFNGAGFTPLGEGGGAPLTKQVFTAYGNANTYVRMYMHAQNNFTAWNKLN